MKENKLRLQKFLSERGVASRRKAAETIKRGLVSVNGVVTLEPGLSIDPNVDLIEIGGKRIQPELPTKRTIILNKPRGYLCSRSSKHGKTIYDLLPDTEQHLLHVGRLDKDSEGLLLLTNDGDLLNRLTHPRYDHEKVYDVVVSGCINDKVILSLSSRMLIDNYTIRPVKIRLLKTSEETNKTTLEFILKEGRKRQIRKMCENHNLKVHRLVRVKINAISLAGLKPGKFRVLTDKECEELS